MKEDHYTDIICKGFCRFYKEGKEELQCGTYLFLRNNLTMSELQSLLDTAKLSLNAPPSFTKDSTIKKMVCVRCEFLVDGCDFREDGSNVPCGGYTILERILSSKT